MFNQLNKILLLAAALMVASCSEPNSKPNADASTADTTDVFDIQKELGKDLIIDSINGYLEKNATDATAFAARAQRHLQLRNLSQALNDAELAITIDSTSAFVQEVVGDVHYITNRTRISKQSWERCIALEPENVSCRMKLAELYNAIEEYRKSLRLVNEVLDREKTNPAAYFLKGLNIVYVSNDTAQAVPYIQRAIELDEQYFEALDLLGVWLTQRKDPLALAYLNRAANISNSASSYYKVGFLHKELDQFELAIEALDKAVQISPNDVESYYLMGYCYVELEEYDAAIAKFDKCLSIREFNHRAYYARGYTYELLNNFAQARLDFGSALKYNPDHEPSKVAMRRLQGK
jgi:tetratricopeptide (TPR) repeat protein